MGFRIQKWNLLLRPKKKCLVSGNPTNLPVLPPTQNFFRHNLHSIKIGNLRSVSQAPFRLHSIVSVQRQHGKTGAQVNHVVVFFQMYVLGTGTLGNVQILSAGFITFPKYKGQFCSTVPSVSLFKNPNDESRAVYVHRVISIMVRNSLHLLLTNTWFAWLGCLPCDYFGGNIKLHKLFYFYVWFLFIIFQ